MAASILNTPSAVAMSVYLISCPERPLSDFYFLLFPRGRAVSGQWSVVP